MKVFISGSKSIAPYCKSGQLPEHVLMEIDKHVDANDAILVGDCSGADALVQQYLESINYRNVTVYISGVQDQTRFNAGKWEEKHFQPAASNGYSFYLEKDLHMAEDADAGLAIWDGNSKGTYINMVCLVAQGKPCHVYLLKEKTWVSVESLNELETYAGSPSRQTNLKYHAWAVAKECQNGAMTWETLKRRIRDLAGEKKAMETGRMVLRPGTREDYDKYIAHVVAADEIYVQYGYEPTEEILEAIREPYAGTMLFSMISKTTGDMLGYIGITEEFDNLEFYTFPDYRNRGYCTEALKVFLQAYLCGDLTGTPHDQVYGETIDINEASMRVLEKCGFEKKAVGMSVSINDNAIILDNITTRYVFKNEHE